MKYQKSKLLILILLIISSSSHALPTVYLSPGHRVYDFLETMEQKKLVTGMHLSTSPITRSEAAKHLYGILQNNAELTSIEREEHLCLLKEFSQDYAPAQDIQWNDFDPLPHLPAFLADTFYRNRRNLFSVSDSTFSLFIDPVIVRKARIGTVPGSSADDNIYLASNGFIMRGTVGSQLGFYIDVRDSKEWGSRDYPEDTSTTLPGRGYASFKGDSAEFDETLAHLTYNQGPFALTFGRDRSVWGRGKTGSLLLSDYGAPYDLLRIETDFWRIKYSFFTGELKQTPALARFYYPATAGSPADSVEVQKYISGHRLDFNISEALNIGLHETVVFAGRWNMSYMNPVMFLKGAEHANGDHDNAAMGLDFRFLPRPRLSFYGEFLIDDITTTKLGTDWYGNKLAWQLGGLMTEPLSLADSDLRLEYTRLNPWVYTHRYAINSYTHYGDVLGHRLGPNADIVSFTARKAFSRRLRFSLAYSKSRRGRNTDRNVGGDPLDGFSPGDSKAAKFLSGDLEKIERFSLDCSYELAWQCFFTAGYSREIVEGEGGNVFTMSLGLNE